MPGIAKSLLSVFYWPLQELKMRHLVDLDYRGQVRRLDVVLIPHTINAIGSGPRWFVSKLVASDTPKTKHDHWELLPYVYMMLILDILWKRSM